MALRFSEESERRLTPEEARAFLRIHAEREAAQTADAPTVDDLAETLGLSSAEAQAILREARARTAPVPKPIRRRSPEALIATLVLSCAGVALSCLLLVAPSPRPTPAIQVLPAIRVAPAAPPLQAPPALAPTLPAPSYAPPALSYRTPPDGFRISIDSPRGSYGTSGPETGLAIDYRGLDALGAAEVEARLVASCLDLIQSDEPARPWGDSSVLNLSIALRNGRWTKLVVPVGSNPSGEELRVALAKVVGTAWPEIVGIRAG